MLIQEVYSLFYVNSNNQSQQIIPDEQNISIEPLKNCLIDKINFNKFISDHLDLDGEPSELEEIDEGFDCVPTQIKSQNPNITMK
jgi:hypothetical protein